LQGNFSAKDNRHSLLSPATFSAVIAQTVFQAIETTLDCIALMTLIGLIVLCVIAARTSRALAALREIEKLIRARATAPRKEVKEEPLPPPLKLTRADIQQARSYKP
jgi:hypothetical protein